MTYLELRDQAEKRVEGEQKEYALERLTVKLRRINEQEMILNKVIEKLDELKADLNNLCTQEVGYPNADWHPGILARKA